MKSKEKLSLMLVTLFLLPSVSFAGTLFQELFDDTAFATRGWYDPQGSGGAVSTAEHIPGSAGSFECNFALNATHCTDGAPQRHKFTPTDSVYVSFWIKHSLNWIGSGKVYHPHMLHFLTNLNADYSGLADTYLTAYVEENQGAPSLGLQDGQNIDETQIGKNLIGITENRSIAGCNGVQNGIGQYTTDCYLMGQVHWNGLQWRSNNTYFFDATTKNNWHFVEAYFQLNTVVNNVGQQNGIMRYWYDGKLEINYSNVIMRTGKNPTMQFNQFILVPYIGDGSPANQTFWIDNLTVATTPPTQGLVAPSPPTNVKVN